MPTRLLSELTLAFAGTSRRLACYVFKRGFFAHVTFFILSCCAQISVAASLTPVEIQIRDYAGSKKEAQIQLLEKLVNINSGSSNIKGIHKVGEIVRDELDDLGFKTRWVEEPDEMHRAGTLIAERTGKQGKHLLLIGHLDTVFPEDSKFQKFELKKNSAKGPGVIDDKGGVIVLLYALKALQAAHALDDTSITVVLTGDEEDSGKPTYISRQPLLEAAKQSDVALDFEPTITLETATIARRGISMWTVESHGNESHSATIFQKDVGAGAIFELSRILNSMRTELSKIKYLSFNPGVELAGNKIDFDKKSSQGTAFGKENVVAKIAMANGDMRFMSEAQKNIIEEKMRGIVKKHLQGTHSTITFVDGIPAMTPTKANSDLLKKYSDASVDAKLGVIKPLDPGLRGAGDISHVSAIVPASLAGLGPVGFASHTVIESIELNSIPIQTQRAALLIFRLTR